MVMPTRGEASGRTSVPTEAVPRQGLRCPDIVNILARCDGLVVDDQQVRPNCRFLDQLPQILNLAGFAGDPNS